MHDTPDGAAVMETAIMAQMSATPIDTISLLQLVQEHYEHDQAVFKTEVYWNTLERLITSKRVERHERNRQGRSIVSLHTTAAH